MGDERFSHLMNKFLVVHVGFSLKNSEYIANVLSVLHMLPPLQEGTWRSKTHFTDPEMKAASNLITFLIPKQVLKLQLSPSNVFPMFLQNVPPRLTLPAFPGQTPFPLKPSSSMMWLLKPSPRWSLLFWNTQNHITNYILSYSLVVSKWVKCPSRVLPCQRINGGKKGCLFVCFLFCGGTITCFFKALAMTWGKTA